MNFKRVLLYALGAVYLLTGLALTYIYVEYILVNLRHLLVRGELAPPSVSPEEGFFIDIVIFFFFLSSLSVTSLQIVNYLFPRLERDITEVPSPSSSPLDVVLHISTEEEKMVLRSVKELRPRAYKFELAKKTGLSRMKIHRIVERLRQRGVLEVTKVGRNSRVKLAEWLEP